MAKGDTATTQNQINASRQQFQPQMQQYQNSLYPQQQQNWQNYNAAGSQQTQDYSNLMGQASQIAQNPNIAYNRSPEMNSAMQGYQGFANTGGFSPQDLQDLRARAVSSVRSQYQNSMDDLARSRNTSGGYSPNYGASLAKMTRDQAYTTSDALTNANAGIAQMVQQGKLSGLQGLGGLSSEDAQLALQALTSNASARLGGIGAGTSLYGASPGMVKTFLNAIQGSNTDLARAFGLSSGYDTDLLKTQAGMANNPGDTTTGIGNVQGVANIYKSVAGI